MTTERYTRENLRAAVTTQLGGGESIASAVDNEVNNLINNLSSSMANSLLTTMSVAISKHYLNLSPDDVKSRMGQVREAVAERIRWNLADNYLNSSWKRGLASDIRNILIAEGGANPDEFTPAQAVWRGNDPPSLDKEPNAEESSENPESENVGSTEEAAGGEDDGSVEEEGSGSGSKKPKSPTRQRARAASTGGVQHERR